MLSSLSVSLLLVTSTLGATQLGQINLSPVDSSVPDGCLGSDFTWNLVGECAKFRAHLYDHPSGFTHAHLSLENGDWLVLNSENVFTIDPSASNSSLPIWDPLQDTWTNNTGLVLRPPHDYVIDLFARGVPDSGCQKSLLSSKSFGDDADNVKVDLFWMILDKDSSTESKANSAHDNTPSKPRKIQIQTTPAPIRPSATEPSCSTLTVINPHSSTVPTPTPTGGAFPVNGTGNLAVLEGGEQVGCLDKHGYLSSPDTSADCGNFTARWESSTHVFSLWSGHRPCDFESGFMCYKIFETITYFYADGDLLVNPWLKYNATHYSTEFPTNKSVGMFYTGETGEGSGAVQIQWLGNEEPKRVNLMS
jgi:hypothetical protein